MASGSSKGKKSGTAGKGSKSAAAKRKLVDRIKKQGPQNDVPF